MRPPALSPHDDSHGKSSFQGSWGKEDGEQTVLGMSVRVMRTHWASLLGVGGDSLGCGETAHM